MPKQRRSSASGERPIALSREVPVPRDPAVEAEVGKTMRLSIWEGAFTMLFLNWTTGPVLAGYLLYFGASPQQIAMAASIPALAQIISPLAAWIYSYFPRPRLLVTVGAGIARGMWISPIFLPLILSNADAGVANPTAVNWVLGLVGLSSIIGAGLGTLWTSWMGAVVPTERRGRYFGLRNGILAVVGLTGNLAAGMILDQVAQPTNYKLVFFLGFVFAMIACATFPFHYEPHSQPRPMRLRDTIAVPLRDRNFRRFLGFAMYWNFAVFTGSVFVYPYFIHHLQLTYTQIAIYQAIAAITTLVCAPLWGRVADKAGNRAVLSVNTFLAGSLMVWCWIFATPGNPTMVWISGVIDGIAWSAIGASIFNLALTTAEPSNRTSYIAVYSMTTGLVAFVGGSLGGLLMLLYEHIEFTVGDFRWSAYHWLFLTTSILRSSAFLLVKGVRETHSWGTRHLLRHLIGMKTSGFGWR